jgi:hypothetical protein
MRNLVEKFYSLSPVKRLLAVVSILLLISVLSVIFSFSQLLMQVKRFDEVGPVKEIGFENIPAHKGYKNIDDSVTLALNGWKTLAQMSEKFLLDPANKLPYRLADGVAEHDQEITEAIRSFGEIDWKYLLLFVSPQLDPLDSPLAESFRKIRYVARFMALYHRRFKEARPEEDSSFILAAQIKLARITDLSSPFLIGKMISVAIDGIAIRDLTSLLEDDLLNQTELERSLELIKSSLVLDRPVKAAMNDEYIFFKHAYGRLYSQAPLGMWVLEKIYGDPFRQYQNMATQMLQNPGYKLDISLFSHNPVLAIAFPNFRKANEVARQKACLKAILIAELSNRTGRTVSVTDPWSGQPLKTRQKDGKTQFYGVGPNGIDDNASGDDILLPENPEI